MRVPGLLPTMRGGGGWLRHAITVLLWGLPLAPLIFGGCGICSSLLA
jgi:hypothetical protein